MKRLATLLLLFLCLPTLAWAFPDNGVLETFTGTDNTSPPNSNWTNAILIGAAGCDIEDNAAAPSATSANDGCYWNPTSFAADQEVYATIVNVASSVRGDVCGRLANIGASTTDGYCASWQDGTAEVQILRIDNQVVTVLGADIAQTIAAGDKIGLKLVGDQICAWFNDGGAGWTEIGCRTDATYTAGGFIGLNLNGNTGVGMMDDFGGGNVAAAGGGMKARNAVNF